VKDVGGGKGKSYKGEKGGSEWLRKGLRSMMSERHSTRGRVEENAAGHI